MSYKKCATLDKKKLIHNKKQMALMHNKKQIAVMYNKKQVAVIGRLKFLLM